MSQNNFHVINWFTNEEKDDDVGYQEDTTAIFVGGERKSPNIAKTDRYSDAGHQELNLVVPFASSLNFSSDFHTSRLLARFLIIRFIHGECWILMASVILEKEEVCKFYKKKISSTCFYTLFIYFSIQEHFDNLCHYVKEFLRILYIPYILYFPTKKFVPQIIVEIKKEDIFLN